MARGGEPIPRPTPHTPYRIIARNRQVAADWAELARTRLGPCIQCWDDLASTPTETVGSRYLPLKAEQAWCEFQGQRLRQWQWEIDRRARVKVGVGKDFVVLISVSSGHPGANE
jgi:hypothetical protein